MKRNVLIAILVAFLGLFAVRSEGGFSRYGYPAYTFEYNIVKDFSVDAGLAQSYEDTLYESRSGGIFNGHSLLPGQFHAPRLTFSGACSSEMEHPDLIQLDKVPSEPFINNSIRDHQFNRTGESLRTLIIPLYSPVALPQKAPRFIPRSVTVGMEVDVFRIADDVKSLGGGNFPTIVGGGNSGWLNPEAGFIRFEWTWGGEEKRLD